jgi:hypothetical protein
MKWLPDFSESFELVSALGQVLAVLTVRVRLQLHVLLLLQVHPQLLQRQKVNYLINH